MSKLFTKIQKFENNIKESSFFQILHGYVDMPLLDMST